MRSRVFIVLFVAFWALTGGCSSCDDSSSGGGSNNDGDAGDVGFNLDGGDNNGLNDAANNGGSDAGNNGTIDMSPDMCTTTVCDGECCRTGYECVDDMCLPPCSGTRCGANLELCCDGPNDVCFAEQCVVPGSDCERTEQCPVDEICEPTLSKCVPRDLLEVCEFIPEPGQFTPTIGCSWPTGTLAVNDSSRYVVVTPTVVNVNDDNGDGVTDTDDIPEIIFHSRTSGCCNKPGTLRIVSGQCNADGTMNTIASLDSVLMANDSAPAVGDLNGDGIPEIVAVKGSKLNSNGRVTVQGLVAWTRTSDDGTTWDVLWENDDYPTWNVHTRGSAAVSLADLEGDGNPEVIVGNVVVNGQDGTLKWDGVVTSNGSGGIGNNAFLGPSSSVGDVDLDGFQEVAAGNTLYDHQGNVLWTYDYTSSNSPCGGALPCDGFTGMADFDGDAEGEIVIIRLGELFILNHDGTLLWKQEIIKDDCANNESGPPTIADFDGDGEPEVGTAAADFYTVMDIECDADPLPAKCLQKGVLWATPNQDCSSRVTASSVFDFDGNGEAEMVYADEDEFRILSGTDGTELFVDTSHSSNTRLETPLVADVDNDGNSEVVIPSATSQGIKVWQDADDNWVRTRRIWNQHAYSVTNVTETGEIPKQPQPNWLNGRLNNFRQNIQPGGLFDAPNLVLRELEARGVGCGEDYEVQIQVTVANEGALGVPPGIPVELFVNYMGMQNVISTFMTPARLLPGQTETFTVNWTAPTDYVNNGFELEAVIDGEMNVNECDEDDNGSTLDSADITFSAPDLVIDTLTVDATTCGVDQQVDVKVVASNAGSQQVPANVPIVVEATYSGGTVEIDTVTTQGAMQPGDSQTFDLTWTAPASAAGKTVQFTATVDPTQQVYQCDETSSATTDADCEVPQ